MTIGLQTALNTLKNKEVYIYGCGMLGKAVASYFLEDIPGEGIRPRAIIVSDGHIEDKEYVTLSKAKIDVLEFSKVKYEDKSQAIYLNTVVSGRGQIKQVLSENNINMLEHFEFYLTEIMEAYADWYYKKIELNLEDSILNFNGVKVYNPCQVNNMGIEFPHAKEILFGTIGDEIIPPMYNDFSLTVDGAYEYGQVTCKEGDVVIDAGANIGLFACYAAYKGCMVYACEPDRNALKILNMQKNIYSDKIEIIPKGLSNTCGKVSFYESEECSLSSIGMPRGNVKETKIELTTVDELIDKGVIHHVDYMKADIEGAERDMLRGAVKTLNKYAPKLSICTYHYPEDRELLESIIKEANPEYVVEHHWRKLYAYVPGK